MIAPYLSLAKYGSVFLAGLFAMWLYHDAAMSQMVADVALERQKAAEQSQLVASKAQKEAAKIDEYFYKKIQSGLAAVPDPKRVFSRARCPAVPTTGVSGVGAGARAELDADGRSVIRGLRRGIVRVETKLAACQALLK